MTGAAGLCHTSGVLGFAIVCAVSAAAWIYLVAAHGGYWLTSQRLPGARWARPVPPRQTGAGPWPAVTAVVPARNEADMLPVTLPALLGQDYPGEFRVVLVDDRSDDGTAGIAAGLAATSAGDGGAPLTVLAGQPRPDGWAGKVWAMAQGAAAAGTRSARVPAVHGRGHRVGARRAARHRRGGHRPTTGRWSRRWRCSARKRRGNG